LIGVDIHTVGVRVGLHGIEALVDRVLVRPREGGVDEIAAVGMAFMNGNLIAVLDRSSNVVDIREVDLRIHPLAEHVQAESHQAYVAGALAVSEKAAFDAVGPCHVAQFGSRDCRSTIVVWMQGQDNGVAACEVAVHPLDGIGIHVRGRHFHGGGEVQNHLPVGRRLPHVGHRIADLEGEFQFGAGVGLGGVLEVDLGLTLHLVGEFLTQLSSVDRNIGDAGLIETEDHATLKSRRRVVEVNDRLLGAADRFERALDQRLPGLREHLNDHVVRDEAFFDDLSHEIEIGLRR